jgi:filamentous hemagglutinin
LSWFGLDDEYRTALNNPYFQAGRQGGSAAMLYLSLGSFVKGIPQIGYSGGTLTDPNNLMQLTTGGVTIVGGEGTLLYAGTTNGASSVLNLFSGDSNRNTGKSPLNSRDATDAAKKLGYTKKIPKNRVPFNLHGQPVFYNSKTKTYISPDADAHNGGVWKMLDRNFHRMGTYNEDLTIRIGD